MTWDAVLLAGGRSSRLGGIDKTALIHQGKTLLETAAAAVQGARTGVVVGGRAVPGMLHTREEPRWSGPVAALAAGLDRLPPDSAIVALLAADLPHAAPALERLLQTRFADDGLVAVDSSGRRQPLLALYRTARLRSAVAALQEERGELAGASLRRLLAPLTLTEVVVPDDLCTDVDTAADAAGLGIALPSPEGALA